MILCKKFIKKALPNAQFQEGLTGHIKDLDACDDRFFNKWVTLSIDSRTIEVGQVFLAVKGAQCDGQDFINHALRQGASVLIVHSQAKLNVALDVQKSSQHVSPVSHGSHVSGQKKLNVQDSHDTHDAHTIARDDVLVIRVPDWHCNNH